MFESKQIIPGTWMQERVVVVDANDEQRQELCIVLEREHFPTTPLHSLVNLETNLQEGKCRVAILDLDSLPVDNRLFRNLKKTFHPELEEAMTMYIHACLGKPVDEEELVFWVKSICENDADSRDPPET
jgi:DNA-binding NtrC family response regulator